MEVRYLVMRLFIAVIMFVSLIFIVGAQARADKYGPCDEDRWMRITKEEWTPRLVKGLIRCVAERWSVPGGVSKALSVAECESGYWPWAVGEDNLGVFQHKERYWYDRVDKFLKKDWFPRVQWRKLQTKRTGAFIARANIVVSIRMAHAAQSWSAWSCA